MTQYNGLPTAHTEQSILRIRDKYITRTVNGLDRHRNELALKAIDSEFVTTWTEEQNNQALAYRQQIVSVNMTQDFTDGKYDAVYANLPIKPSFI